LFGGLDANEAPIWKQRPLGVRFVGRKLGNILGDRSTGLGQHLPIGKWCCWCRRQPWQRATSQSNGTHGSAGLAHLPTTILERLDQAVISYFVENERHYSQPKLEASRERPGFCMHPDSRDTSKARCHSRPLAWDSSACVLY